MRPALKPLKHMYHHPPSRPLQRRKTRPQGRKNGRVFPSEAEPGSVAVSSSPGAVVEVDHAIAETAFAQQFELHADIVGERLFAAFHHDGRAGPRSGERV